MSASDASADIFVRKSTGLVRDLTAFDAFNLVFSAVLIPVGITPSHGRLERAGRYPAGQAKAGVAPARAASLARRSASLQSACVRVSCVKNS